MPLSSAQGRVGTTDGANRCRDLNARATMVVTPQQYHYACEAFIGYELHRFQIIVAEVFEYMIANILDREFPSFKLRPRIAILSHELCSECIEKAPAICHHCGHKESLAHRVYIRSERGCRVPMRFCQKCVFLFRNEVSG